MTDPNVEQIMTWNQAYLYVQKDAKQNFGTSEDPIWAVNYIQKTFLKSTKPIVLFVSDRTLTLYSYLSILVGKISTVFLQILEYLLTDQGFESPEQSWYFWLSIKSKVFLKKC